MAACEAAATDMLNLEMDNEKLHRFQDMQRRFHGLLKDGGHL
jgi:hypothetical protein